MLLRPQFTFAVGDRSVPAFRAFGVAGLAAATLLSTAAAAMGGARVGVELLIVVQSVLVFLALALVTKAVAGRETLIYYHHEIAVLLAAAALAAILGQPVLAHLDATAIGLGGFLAFGRLGCACAAAVTAGRRGRVVYGAEHVAAGLPHHFAGRPLAPLQLVEAGAVAPLTAAGALAVGSTPRPGSRSASTSRATRCCGSVSSSCAATPSGAMRAGSRRRSGRRWASSPR